MELGAGKEESPGQAELVGSASWAVSTVGPQGESHREYISVFSWGRLCLRPPLLEVELIASKQNCGVDITLVSCPSLSTRLLFHWCPLAPISSNLELGKFPELHFGTHGDTWGHVATRTIESPPLWCRRLRGVLLGVQESWGRACLAWSVLVVRAVPTPVPTGRAGTPSRAQRGRGAGGAEWTTDLPCVGDGVCMEH